MSIVERILYEQKNCDVNWCDPVVGEFIDYEYAKFPSEKLEDRRKSVTLLSNFTPEELEVMYAKYQVEKDL